MSDISQLKPWTDLVRLHPDIEEGEITQSKFAVDLGAVALGDKSVPAVNRDPKRFFEATYLTSGLRSVLDEVLQHSLAGSDKHNRIIKLRTPFGGGKSHLLASLLHAARDRSALDSVPEAAGMAHPGEVRVAVVDGEKLAVYKTTVAPGRNVSTLWGWIAWQIGQEKAYALIEQNDRDQVSPSGDEIHRLLTEGADNKPVLILLDEVLKYMERAAGIRVGESTLQRQSMDFFQNLTVEVARIPRTVLVYSLQWSATEALDNVSLLNALDKLASRVDELREPVPGDEILPVLQRRLLASAPKAGVPAQVSRAYEEAVTGARQASASTESERQQAQEAGVRLRDRMESAYPLHPALIDAMKERWTSVEAFQRTRGALRFLGQSLKSVKKGGNARPLLGPGDIPLDDQDAREAMLKELGAHQDFAAVISSDIAGPLSRARRIDERMAREKPELGSARPATRLATAIFVYSFGGLRRDQADHSDSLPPGISMPELLDACIAPDLDRVTLTSALGELRNDCLYLHYDGSRYCFKTTANVTKLIEDAAGELQSQVQVVTDRIKVLLEQQFAGRPAILWPERASDLPNREAKFTIAYMHVDTILLPGPDKENKAKEFFTRFGDRPRDYKNAVGIAFPDRTHVETLRRHVRYLVACERIEQQRAQHRLTREMTEQLAERKRSEVASVGASLRQLYSSVWLPVLTESDKGAAVGIEKVDIGARPLQQTTIHERLIELLAGSGIPKLYTNLIPRRVAEIARLGDEKQGVPVAAVVDSFFAVLSAPRLIAADVLQRAITSGVAQEVFAYASAPTPPRLNDHGLFDIARDKVRLGKHIPAEEVDLETGFLISPSAAPTEFVLMPPPALLAVPDAQVAEEPAAAPEGISSQSTDDGGLQQVHLRFMASRDEIYKAFRAIANLAERSAGGKVRITIEATSAAGDFDRAWLRNAVEEPIEEAGIVIEL